MVEWLVSIFRTHVEIPLFLCLAIGYFVGKLKVRGLSLGDVTATLLAGLVIGQLGITVSPDIKTVFFVLFLFSVGYSAGPQFVRGLFSGGASQAVFACVVCGLCLGSVLLVAWLAGTNLGTTAGLFAGATTTSSALGLSTTAIDRLNLSPEAMNAVSQLMPAAFAVSYIVGTFGSVLILGIIGPAVMRIDLAAACRAYAERMGGTSDPSGRGTAWHQYVARAYRIEADSPLAGKTSAEIEAMFPQYRLFVVRLRRASEIIEATSATVIQGGDVVAISGTRSTLLDVVGHVFTEVDDPELLRVPVEGTDILITSRQLVGKSLAQLAHLPEARGIFLTQIHRGAMAVSIPILPATTLYRGDILTVVGRPADISAAARKFGYADRETDRADVSFIGIAIAAGAILGSLTWKVGEVPLTLSTAGGVLLVGLLLGWLRSVRPAFGRVPRATGWFMNSVGLNMFIAVIGLSAGPGVLHGLQELGFAFVLWSVVATSVPLFAAILIGRYLFRFDDAILFGCCAGARSGSAALSMVLDRAESQVPALGYSVAYATSSTILTLFGMVIVLLS
ncbi:aspartate-alanine antiporter [Amorphus sp. 3PC139-8]|uniref:aspartate-alanine antiporter n=1 Tax=Amorphus sp. 3PC139-8 TaxID=2735676 RepID=UPI00345DF895